MSKVIWTPQPRQAKFMARGEFEAFYGGAAGGGKSDALLAEALRQINKPQYVGIIFRKTYPELRELIQRSSYLYKRAVRGAKYNNTEHVWNFPTGAKIYFGNISYDFKNKYQGQHFDFIGFDELTHFTYDEYMYLFSRNRPSAPGMRNYIRATGNPGGIGHGWVKDRFITAGPPEKTMIQDVEIETPTGEVFRRKRSRIFIPSSVFENKILMENNPDYVATLAMLPEAQKKALLYGDWNSFNGQVFTEWRDEPRHYKDHKYTHVIDPFIVPDHWPIYRGLDWGYSRPFSVGWYAVAPDRTIYRIMEYYGCTGTPNEGIQLEPHKVAANIRQIEATNLNLKNKKIIGSIADPAIFNKDSGESIANMFEASPNFICWSRGDNERIAGKMQYHYRFAFDEEGRSMFYVFNTNKNFIRTIPNLVYDDKNVEDINSDMEDHIYDECRYVFMENPIAPRYNKRNNIKIPDSDPLRMYEDYKPYGMM